jgi:hypothetical protein
VPGRSDLLAQARHPDTVYANRTWFAFTSYRRATTETELPEAKDAATISRFNASGHDR